NILIDGEGWTLNGVDFTIWEGFNLTGVSNVTIIDVNIERFASYSVYLNSASECVISRNTVMGSEGGIGLFSSNGNMISDNEISGCSEAVELVSSSGNVVSGNNMSDSSSGVYLIRSTSNVVSGNRMTANSRGMYLASANFSAITGNKITANTNDGISLYISTGNSISENDVMNNSGGIVLAASTNNSIAGNTVTGNIAGIRAHGALVNSAYVGSMNNTIIGNNVVHNTNGVDVVGVFFTTISRNYIAENSQYGITLDNANNNTISANNIADNNLGIYYDGLCNNNTAYHNNFFGNAKHVEVSPGDIDAWDDGVEGNYWSNYTGADLNHDGVGDSWHEIYENNTDRHPLMGPFHSFNTTLSKHVNVISNSTIESFQYFESNSTAIMLVSNMTASQTHGFCRISLPYEVMSGPYNVTIDGAFPTYWNYSIYDNGTHKWIYFEYEHSTLKIIIVPEFPSFLILQLFMIATLLVVIVYRRKRG
ncbi:MAG: right-handed parallel beta-helix repeat-containing protein, partial [Candidatus Bathyarchaeota archaeon]